MARYHLRWHVPVLALPGLVLLALPVQGAVPSTGSTAKHAQGAQVIERLHAAKQLLEHAKHDYEGQRAKAVHHITSAINALEHHHGKQHGHHDQKDLGKNETQAHSDALLRQAVEQLQAVEKELKGEHHVKAKHEVAKAIQELHTALRIK